MNFKTQPKTPLLSWMVIASLTVLGTDTAWSEAPANPQGKKAQVKKTRPAARKPGSPARTPAKPREGEAGAKAPAPGVVASALPVAAVAASAPASAQGTAPAPMPAPAAAARTAQPLAGSSAAVPPQPVVNPYLTVPQPNPWTVQVSRVPGQVNPYLAWRSTAPAPAASPSGWGMPVFPPAAVATPWTPWAPQIPAFPTPTWLTPFAAFQPPTPPQPAFAPPAPPAWANPYLAYKAPVMAGTPWTPPTFKAPPLTFPAWPAPDQPRIQQPLAQAIPATPWTPPVLAVPAPMSAAPAASTWGGNPYLAFQRAPVPVAPPALTPAAPAAPALSAQPQATPWGAPQPAAKVEAQRNPQPASGTGFSLGGVWDSLKSGLLPDMPPSDQAILPTLKTVYPTGEKPLKVLTFKCPTELIGVTPLPTKALHELVNVAMDGINRTDLLPFNMQQVCQ